MTILNKMFIRAKVSLSQRILHDHEPHEGNQKRALGYNVEVGLNIHTAF
jgi:hypothetical protein